MSFNNEGFISNTPNFFRDFASNRYPRFFNLTGSTQLDSTKEEPVNSRLMLDPQMRQRNLLIVPNDNGKFNPDYTLLLTGTYATSPTTSSLMRRFVNDASVTDLSIISLNRMLDGRTTLKEIEAGGTHYLNHHILMYILNLLIVNPQNKQDKHSTMIKLCKVEAELEPRLDNPFVITSDWELNVLYLERRHSSGTVTGKSIRSPLWTCNPRFPRRRGSEILCI